MIYSLKPKTCHLMLFFKDIFTWKKDKILIKKTEHWGLLKKRNKISEATTILIIMYEYMCFCFKKPFLYTKLLFVLFTREGEKYR